MKYLLVKNWAEFQHYKDRLPPWIKLHTHLLRDYDFNTLADEAKAHLMLIWLLASQLDGRVPNDPTWIREHSGMKKRPDLDSLIAAGWLIPQQDASTTLAPRQHKDSATPAECEQPASPHATRARTRGETEAYKASEAETEQTKPEPSGTPSALTGLPHWLPTAAWADFIAYRKQRKGWTAKAEALCLRELGKLREAGHDPVHVIETAIMRQWTGLFPPDKPRANGAQRNESLAEKRARNMEILTGRTRDERTIEGTADRVGSAVVLPIASDLRQPDVDDVGGSEPGRSASGLG